MASKKSHSAEFFQEETDLLTEATLINFSASLQAYITLVKQKFFSYLTATKTTHIFTAMKQ